MENQVTPNTQQPFQPAGPSQGMKIPLPNSTAVLVLGILSIVICCFFGVIMGIIALVLASKGKVLYDSNPMLYTESSYNNLKAGKICAIIGLILSALTTLYYFIAMVILGTAFSWIPWDLYNT
jgi:hypothetical protein